jgi:CHAT domain-containing protein
MLAKRLGDRRLAGPPPHKAACPPLAEWGQWQAGMLPETRSMELIVHAADCEACGALMADLRSEEGEAAEAPPSEGWRQWMAVRLSGPASRPRPLMRGWLGIAAGLTLVLGGATGWWIYRAQSSGPVMTAIAQSYAGQRPFAFRFSGAPYGPVRVTRGGGVAVQSAELLEAEARVARHLRAHPDDVTWLRAKGRADLLDGRYDSAINELRHAQETAGRSAEVLADLAMAYVARGSQEKQAADVAMAVELLSQAIQLDPRDAVYWFNRALAREELPAPHEAADDWRKFLNLEPSGGWAEEAREHLRRLELLLGKQRGSTDDTGSDLRPAIVLAALQGTDTSQVAVLAEGAMAQHGDPWARDLAADVRRGSLSAAIDLALRAEQAGAHGQPDESADFARRAVVEFTRRGSTAGVVLARYQQARALERGAHPAECEDLAPIAAASARKAGYLWLEAQLDLALAACAGMERRFAQADLATSQAETIAARGRYDASLLQASAWHAALLGDVGAYRDVLRICHEALNRYWAGSYPLARAYECYFEMAGGARGLGVAAAAATFSREAVEVAALHPNRAVEGMIRSIHAQDLVAAGLPGNAESYFTEAEHLLGSLKRTSSTQLYLAYASLGRAEVAAIQKRPVQGLNIISKLGASLAGIHNAVAETRYGRLKGALLEESGDRNGAEASFRNVLACCAGASQLTSEANMALGALVESMLRRGQERDALRVWETYYPAFRSASAHRTAVRITFASLPEGPAVWTSLGERVQLVRLPTTSERLRLMAGNLRREISDSRSEPDRIRHLGSELYRVLFGGIDSLLPDKGRLWISMDQSFENVPFDVLVDSRGQWLGSRYQLSYWLPTRSVSSPRQELSPAANLLAVGFGGASQLLGRELPALADAEREASEAAGSFRESTLLLGDAANAASLQRLLAAAEVFHFSGHVAVFPENAAFALSGGALWASQLSDRDLRLCRLAVLSACSTATTDDAGANAAMARVFLRLGVPQVVAARWDVESRATAALMHAFYEKLRSGAAVDDSLSAAAARLRADPQFAHPYYWAAFGLYCN